MKPDPALWPIFTVDRGLRTDRGPRNKVRQSGIACSGCGAVVAELPHGKTINLAELVVLVLKHIRAEHPQE